MVECNMQVQGETPAFLATYIHDMPGAMFFESNPPDCAVTV
ncbi:MULTISPECIES: hypothetical protein [Cupriavidus]